MKQSFSTIRLTSLFTLCLAATPGHCADWYAAATSCVPYPEAINARQYSNANGRLRFNPNMTGTMYFACNVGSSSALMNTTGRLADNLYLSLTYQILGDVITNVQTSAELKGVNKISGNITNIASVGRNLGSLPASQPSIPITISSQAFSGQTLDFVNNYYYVIITLSRQTTAFNPIVYGVGLTEHPIRIEESVVTK